jgi:hypothetical protein
MLTSNRRALVWLISAAIGAAAAAGCEKVPLLAPTGSTITLTSSTPVLSANGRAQIVAQLIEAAGTPPHSGTHVTFTTSLGAVQPVDAETDVNGRAIVTFLAGNNNGTAIITASSGAATTGTTNGLRIAVGSAAVGRVAVNANPTTVPAIGGSSAITATVLDVNGNPLTSTPVQFSTTAGTLSSAIVSTDANGIAATILVTSQQATVTASVGAQAPPSTGGGGTSSSSSSAAPPPSAPASPGTASGSVTVVVTNAPTLVITPPTNPPSVGIPAAFTFAVTAASSNGSAVRDLTVAWGDGATQDLGAVTGNAVVSHVYTRVGTFVVTGTVTDAAGNRSTVSTSTTVIPVARPTVLVTPTPTTVIAPGTINFTIQITAPAGIGIISTTIDFGDGRPPADLGGATSATVPHNYTTAGNFLVTVTVTDTAGNVTTGTTSVSVT